MVAACPAASFSPHAAYPSRNTPFITTGIAIPGLALQPIYQNLCICFFIDVQLTNLQAKSMAYFLLMYSHLVLSETKTCFHHLQMDLI